MNISAGVLVLNEASGLAPTQATSFAPKDDFQEVVARFPALLAGDQMNSANPRRFTLIDRGALHRLGTGRAPLRARPREWRKVKASGYLRR